MRLSVKHEQLVLNDAYYDDSLYTLTTNDMWLRERNEMFELKFPMRTGGSSTLGLSGIDYFNESTNWPTICDSINALGLPHLQHNIDSNVTFVQSKDWLSKSGITIFSRFRTRRTRQRVTLSVKSGFVDLNIDLDEVDFLSPDISDMSVMNEEPFVIGEIELVSTEEQYSGVVLAEVFDQLQLSESRIRGKVLEYIYRYRPNHYQALTQCGIIGSKGIL